MKITIYTINDCQFSKEEKEYLKAHNLPFEEKNLETNKDYLTEMLAISNNFAGTPVTKVEKDDGQILVLKGFTKEEFEKSLNLTPTTPEVDKPKVEATPLSTPIPEPTPPPVTVPPPAPMEPPKPSTQPPMTDPTPPLSPPSTVELSSTPQVPVQQAPEPTPIPAQPSSDPSLDALLSDLRAKAGAPAVPSAPPSSDMPSVPDFSAK